MARNGSLPESIHFLMICFAGLHCGLGHPIDFAVVRATCHVCNVPGESMASVLGPLSERILYGIPYRVQSALKEHCIEFGVV